MPPPAKTHNLILVHRSLAQDRRDFEEIGEKIRELEPRVDVHIAKHNVPLEQNGLAADMWNRPTLTISFWHLGIFRPKRGTVLCGRYCPKIVQLSRFKEMGVRSPTAMIYDFRTALDRKVMGDLVVLKSGRGAFASNGNCTFLLRTPRAAEMAARVLPPTHPARRGPMIVQRFIDTGEYPANYRVLCLLGEPLLAMEYRSRRMRPPLDASDDALLHASIASNAEGNYSHALVAPSDVLGFARQVAATMPRVPLQGIDIVREQSTGQLFVLENNPGGNTWHFSSKMSEEGRREVTREQRIAQFGAWDIAARALVASTLRHAA